MALVNVVKPDNSIDKIKEIEREIDQVQREIEDVGTDINNTLDIDERKMLRREKEQLRKKEEQLRSEKARREYDEYNNQWYVVTLMIKHFLCNVDTYYDIKKKTN